MSPIFFAHANGFPASCYQYFFEQLQPNAIHYKEIFGAGPYRIGKSWKNLAPEAIEAIEKVGKPVIGLGHSFGGVVLFFVAQQRPDLFRQLIMIDPPIFSRKVRFFTYIMKRLGLTKYMVPIVRQAGKRKDFFESREAARTYFKQKAFFQRFHPQCLEDYVQHGLSPVEGGFTLRIPKALEQKIFSTPPSFIASGLLDIPSHYIYATKGVVGAKEWAEHKTLFSQTVFLPWEGGHMFPLESPENSARFFKSLFI